MKTNISKNISRTARSAFTLIELLVVITIIATLASISFPVFNTVIKKGHTTKAIAHGKQVVTACMSYASDNNGKFPTLKKAKDKLGRNGSTSNDALALLVPRYTGGSEEIFSVPTCDVAEKVGIDGPDNDFKDDGSDSLEAGENHWAYVDNLRMGMSRVYPMVMDAFANTSTPSYTDIETDVGGRWGGEYAVVIFTDSSGAKIDLDTEKFTIPSKKKGSTNGFTQKPWRNVKKDILNPDGA